MIVFLIPTSPQNTMLPLTTNTCSPKQHFIFHFFFGSSLRGPNSTAKKLA